MNLTFLKYGHMSLMSCFSVFF